MERPERIMAMALFRKEGKVKTGWFLAPLSLLLLIGLLGCRPTFDMGVYEDSLNSLFGRNGINAASALMDQSIVSSELVSARIPPGIYAEHGLLLYHQGKSADAVRAIEKEETLYPESKLFTQRLLGMIQGSVAEQSNPQANHSPHTPSILIVPLVNKSNSTEAVPAFEMTLSRPLIERGYYVFPVVATQTLFRKNKLGPESEWSAFKELTGADALLYITISEWVKTGLYPSIRLTAEYRLIDSTTGQELWKSSQHGEFGYQVMAVGGYPVYAGVISDYRIPARSLTQNAITASQGGLPYGPYRQK